MSKASEWATYERRIQRDAEYARGAGPKRPVFYSEQVSLAAPGGGVWADRLVARAVEYGISESSVLRIENGHASAADALKLAHWILDTYGETGQ